MRLKKLNIFFLKKYHLQIRDRIWKAKLDLLMVSIMQSEIVFVCERFCSYLSYISVTRFISTLWRATKFTTFVIMEREHEPEILKGITWSSGWTMETALKCGPNKRNKSRQIIDLNGPSFFIQQNLFRENIWRNCKIFWFLKFYFKETKASCSVGFFILRQSLNLA